MKNILFLSLFGLLTFSTNAQDCQLELSGKVIDLHDNSPLAFAIVTVVETQQVTEANREGYYSIKGLCAGHYTLQVTHVACETIEQKIQLKGNTTYNFQLEHHIDELNEVLLTSNVYQEKKEVHISKILQKSAIDRSSHLNFGDMLSQLNGVSTLHTGASISKPIIQGMHSARVLVINNNVRMQDQQWGVDHAPNIDPTSSAYLEVIKGASALRYGGDAVGGVIVSTPQKAPIKDTLFGKSILNLNSNGMGGGITTSLLKSTQKGWYVKTHASSKRLGDLHTPDYVLSNTGSLENNFSIGFGLNKIKNGFNAYYSLFSTELGILRASHIGNVRDLVNAINRQQPSFIEDFTYRINSPRQEVQHHLFKLDYFTIIDNLGKLETQYAFQFNHRKEYDVRRGNRSDRAALDLELTTHQWINNLSMDNLGSLQVNVGTELSYQNHFANPETGVRRLIPDYDLFSAAGYVTAKYPVHQNLLLDAGARYDYTYIDALKFYRTSRWEERGYQNDFSSIIVEDLGTQLLTNPVFHYHNFSASMGAAYTINPNTKLTTQVSLATRNPNPSELFSDGLHHSTATIELGDLRLQQEKAYKLNVALAKEFSNFNFEINPYISLIADFMTLEPNGIETTIRGAFPVFEYRQTQALVGGVDMDFSYQVAPQTQLHAQFSYTYADDTKLDRPIIDIPPVNTRTVLTHTLERWKNLRLNLTHEWVAKQNRFPDLDFTTPVLNPELGELEQTEVNISESPDAFQLVHVGMEMPLQWNQMDLRIAINVHNVFDTSYRNYLNRQRFYADEVGRNFQLQIQLNY